MKIELIQDWSVNYSELTLEVPTVWVVEEDVDYYNEGDIVFRPLTREQLDKLTKVLIDNCYDIRVKFWMPNTGDGPRYELVLCVGDKRIDYRIFE